MMIEVLASGIYVVLYEETATTVAKTLVEYLAPADQSVAVLKAWITQNTLEASEQLEAVLRTFTATGTGTAFTPRKMNDKMVAAAGSAKVNMSVEGTGGEVKFREGFNLLNGFYWPTTNERWTIDGGLLGGLRLDDAPAASTTISAGLLVAEI